MRHVRGSVDPVNVHVKGKHFPVSVDMRSHVVAKMQRLNKYLDRLSAIEVELCVEPSRDVNHHNRVEATTRVAGRTIRVEATQADMYSAVDEAVDKMYRQLNRRKERMKAHNGARLADVASLDGALEPGYLDSVSEASDGTRTPTKGDVRVERLDMKPQFEDEAISEIRATGQSFYVFLNAANEQVNVLYRRDDGSLGLIQPRV